MSGLKYHGGMKGLYAMLALTEASLVNDDVDTTQFERRSVKTTKTKGKSRSTCAQGGAVGFGLAEHQVALPNHRHRSQIHSRRRPLPLPDLDAGGTGRDVHAPL